MGNTKSFVSLMLKSQIYMESSFLLDIEQQTEVVAIEATMLKARGEILFIKGTS